MTEPRGVRRSTVIAVAVVAGFLVWLLVIRDSGSGSANFNIGTPTEISESDSDVASLASAAGHTVYWLGSQPNTKLEATLLSNGNVYVRYLSADTPIGEPKPDFPAVGTYPVVDGYKALKGAAKQPGAVVDKTPDGGLVVTNKSNPNQAYIAYRDQDLQVEVYDPKPKQALKFATSGEVTPVG